MSRWGELKPDPARFVLEISHQGMTPFTFMQCWENPEHREQFKSATGTWWSKSDHGEVLELNDDKLGCPPKSSIGVTGWFPVGLGEVALRWTAIYPDKRGKGFSYHLLNLLFERLRGYYIHTVYELSETEKARDFFLKMGFCLVQDETLKDKLRAQMGDFKYVLEKKL